MKERHVGISLGNIGALHDGLGEFSWQIGQRLAARAARWRAEHGLVLHVHCRERLGPLFGSTVRYIPVNRWQRWRHDQRTRALMARTDELAAISHHTAADVRRHLGWTGEITVIHNGARSFAGSPQQPLPGWTLDPGQPFLFHLSRMSPSKNPQALLGLAAEWPEMMFVLAGPPSDDAKALRAANRLPNVQFHLGVDDAQKAWAYARCAGFLFPSLTEGFGLPPIEAMHFGKPVFLARRTCLPEIGGDAASYFDSFEAQAMKAVVQQGLLRHAEPGRPEAVREHAAQFNWDDAAAAYLALYRRLLGLPG